VTAFGERVKFAGSNPQGIIGSAKNANNKPNFSFMVQKRMKSIQRSNIAAFELNNSVEDMIC
jgi:hypothetical protein